VSVFATVVETKDLLETVVFSIVAGIGVTAIFSVAIWGAARFTDLSQEERRLEAGFAAVAAVTALLAVLAAVVIGVIVMTSK
jgi:nitrogen fixation/metabolism regulation signal transduction histidine kinase